MERQTDDEELKMTPAKLASFDLSKDLMLNPNESIKIIPISHKKDIQFQKS